MLILSFMWDVRVIKARTWIAEVFVGTWWVEDTSRMLVDDVMGVALHVYVGGA